MHHISKHPLPKSGLLIGVILGISLVTLVSEALDHVTVRSVSTIQNSAAVFQSFEEPALPGYLATPNINPFNGF